MIATFIDKRWHLAREDLELKTLSELFDILDMIELVMMIEKMYHVSITDEQMSKCQNYSDLVKLVVE